jgi:hypothetical protein
MIHVDFDPSKLMGEQLAWWTAWAKKADAAAQAVIDKWERTGEISSKKDFDDEIWGELKDWFLKNFFNYKCGYCETGMGRQRREAEHYRPKAGVKYRQGGLKRLATARGEGAVGPVTHPGYFWLAYHWMNLVPCCSLCNSGGGKNNQFPVALAHVLLHALTAEELQQHAEPPRACAKRAGYYYLSPAYLDRLEEPLLLHPFVDEPRDHLRFGDGGIESAREDGQGIPSPKGKNSITVYDLKDDQLRGLRCKAQLAAEADFWLAYGQARRLGLPKDKGWSEARDTVVASAKKFNGPYLAAVLDWIELLTSHPPP